MTHGYGAKTTTGAVRFVHLSERQVGLPLTPEPYPWLEPKYIYIYISLKWCLVGKISVVESIKNISLNKSKRHDQGPQTSYSMYDMTIMDKSQTVHISDPYR